MKRKKYLAIWRIEESEYQKIVNSELYIADDYWNDNNDDASLLTSYNIGYNDNVIIKSDIKAVTVRSGYMITLGS